MNKRNLLPPLSVIENDLFGQVEQPANCETPPELKLANVAESDVAMPAFIKDAIERRAKATAAYPSNQPLSSGQIRRILAVDRNDQSARTLARPVSFLLDRESDSSGQWSGWMVSPEVDYATAWDVLLEADVDEPFDPAAGMIQLWNPLVCKVPVDADLLAQLSDERLDTVRTVAKEFPRLSNAGTPRPGFVAPRTVGAYSVLTGSPLGAGDDERRSYQSLYQQLARELDVGLSADKVIPLRATQPKHGIEIGQRQHVGEGILTGKSKVWLAIAASVMVVQAGVIGLLVQKQDQVGDQWEGRFAQGKAMREEAPGFRSSISKMEKNAVDSGVRKLVFSFRPDAKAVDVDKALRELGVKELYLENEPNRFFLVVESYRVKRIIKVLAPLASGITEMR